MPGSRRHPAIPADEPATCTDPARYNRELQRVFYTSAMISIQRSPASKAFYDRKRAEGKRHVLAVLALARRRVDVMWAMLRDQRTYQERLPNLATAA
jgi:hypothetical protein